MKRKHKGLINTDEMISGGSTTLCVSFFFLSVGIISALPQPVPQDASWNNIPYRWNVEKYPDPRTSPRFCRRFLPSSVCDPDDIITPKEADMLDSLILQVYNDTPCICTRCGPDSGGIIIGIALLKSTYQPYNERPTNIIRKFAETLRKQWNLGECENDMLIVVATEDKQSYTDVGSAIAGHISPEKISRIFIENKAHFVSEKYYLGLQSLVQSYYDLSKDIPQATKEPPTNVALIAGIIIAVIVLIIIIVLVSITMRKCCSLNNRRKDSVSGDVSSSWKRKDKTFPPFNFSGSKYQSCKTEDVTTGEVKKNGKEKSAIGEEEIINTDLQIIPEDMENENVDRKMPDETTTLQAVTEEDEDDDDSEEGEDDDDDSEEEVDHGDKPETSDPPHQRTEQADVHIRETTFTTFTPNKIYAGHSTNL